MKTLPVALQTYTVRDFAEKDFKGTMQAVKDMGYDYIEMAGLYGLSADEVKAILDEVGLKAVSTHAPLAELVADMEGTIDNYLKIGCEFMAIPYLDDGLRPGQEGFGKVLADIKVIGEMCYNKGVTLLYHNHDFEFVKLENGEYGLDDMYANVDSRFLQTELDTCWVKVAGECPVEYIKKYSGRCPVVHLKDFVGQKSENMYELIGIDKKVEQTEEFAFKPVGYGVQDFPAILAAAVESGAQYVVVEQDRSDDCTSLEAAKKSRDYLKTLGW